MLEPLGAPSYYEKRPVWSLDILFKNKMLVMLAAMMGGTLLLTKMMANMDPEEMKKMQQVRALRSKTFQLCFAQTRGLLEYYYAMSRWFYTFTWLPTYSALALQEMQSMPTLTSMLSGNTNNQAR